jgi:hypothetical protein
LISSAIYVQNGSLYSRCIEKKRIKFQLGNEFDGIYDNYILMGRKGLAMTSFGGVSRRLTANSRDQQLLIVQMIRIPGDQNHHAAQTAKTAWTRPLSRQQMYNARSSR